MKQVLYIISIVALFVTGCQMSTSSVGPTSTFDYSNSSGNTFSPIVENGFTLAIDTPQSTFSIDVDIASYAIVRRYILEQNTLPPSNAVRIEEMVNYFTYDYPEPTGNEPFSITTEVSTCPWETSHKLIHIGLQGKKIDIEQLPASNLVFLIDVSGSMDEPDKLPLLKEAFRMLTNELRPEDHIAIVTYAGNAGLALPSTSGADKQKILDALDRLEAGGSTNGGEGISLAYKIAEENFIQNGNNRVLLATDGDFNVGITSEDDLVRLIEQKRDAGIFLTTLGVGYGNYNDANMEKLADNGNGFYAYLDNLNQARRVLTSALTGTLLTIAKDVKIQVTFDPTFVRSYRLIGYEDRTLQNQDFNNDRKDAGDLGAGQSVTALYELIPQNFSTFGTSQALALDVRYKNPTDSISHLVSRSISELTSPPTQNLNWASSVVQFAMLMRDSKYKGNSSLPSVLTLATQSKGSDLDGARAEFIDIVNKYTGMKK